MKFSALPVLFLLLALALSACEGLAPSSQVEISPTDTPTTVPTNTPTIVWFPPTSTPTSMPTPEIVPTPEMHPGLGKITLEDSFEDETSWQTSRTSVGSVAFGNNELTLAIAEPKGSLLSLRDSPVLDDFYLEVTANPSLCRGADMYGLLLRASSSRDFYRLMINCNGMLRVERLKNGEAVLLQDWTPSGQVPPGSPLEIRLGVWAVKDELRFFINDVYQFSVKDPVWKSGKIGVFARSADDTALTVSFSKLVIRTVQPDLAPTATSSISFEDLNSG